jgi:Family of unknown function (DUF6059)
MATQPARWRRWSRFAWRAVILGLQHYGATHAGMVLRPAQAAQPGPYGPPPGHPERLAIDLPLSTVEAQLWAQLGHQAGL